MGRSPIANPQSFWAKNAPMITTLVGVTVLLLFAWGMLSAWFETKAHAEQSYANLAAAQEAAKADCEINTERSLGKIRVETAEIRGSVTKIEGNVSRIDATMQRIADKLGVPPTAPLAVPPKE